MNLEFISKLVEVGNNLNFALLGDVKVEDIVDNMVTDQLLREIDREDDKETVMLNYVVTKFIVPNMGPCESKREILRTIGVDVGEDVFIAPDVLFDPIYPENITIEDGATIGWGASLFTHIYGPDRRIEADELVIGEKAFIGGYSTVHPGVEVRGMLYNHSLAKCDIPEGEEWGGIPAKLIKGREEDGNK